MMLKVQNYFKFYIPIHQLSEFFLINRLDKAVIYRDKLE